MSLCTPTEPELAPAQARAEAEARASRRALALLANVSHAIVESDLDLSAMFTKVAREVAETLGDCCSVRLLSGDGEWLELGGFYHPEPAVRAQVEPRIRAGAGLSGRVLQTWRPLRRTPHELPSAADAHGASADAVACAPGLSVGSAMIVPLAARGELLGTVSVSRPEGDEYGDSDQRLLEDLADRLAIAVTLAKQHAELNAERERLHAMVERLAVLTKASDLLAQSLDYERTLQSVSELVLPTLGDFGFFDLREGGQVRRIARAHGDDRPEALRCCGSWTAAEHGELNLCALASGKSGFYPQIDEAWLRRAAHTPEQLACLRQLALKSMITVPLSYQGSTLGALTLFFAWSGRHHAESDLNLAQELARRAAAAIVNARLFKEAQEAIGVRDDFLSMAGHELRTPLTALQLQILSISKMIGQDGVVEKIAGRAEKASRNVLRLSNLVNELLDISRISAGRLRLEPSPMDLAEAVREVLAQHADELSRSGCELRFSVVDDARGTWDRMRVEQIASYLLANAIKYGKGKPIEVSVERDSGSARLTVVDHGIGISPEDQQRIFERFERAVSSRHFGGLGFGLWIARQLVDAHGGTIRVASQQDRGAKFEVELPLAPPKEVRA